MTDGEGSTLREVVAVDLDELNLRSALVGLIVLTVALALVAVVGPAGMAAGIAALFVVAGGSGDATRTPADQAAFVALGALITLAAGYAAEWAVAASLVIGALAFASTLAARRGPVAAANGAYLLIWAVLTLSIGDSETTPPAMAGAFVLGGGLALVALAVTHRIAPVPEDRPAPGGMDPTALLRYAVIRAVGAGACVALGYWWFPDHAAWAAFAFVLVLRPPREQVIVTGVGRTIGTVAGVVLGMVIADLVGDSDLSLLLAFGVCAFAMLATSDVNYALSTTFTTALLLIAQRIIQEDVFATGWDRLGATVVGVAVAFLAILAVRQTREPAHGR